MGCGASSSSGGGRRRLTNAEDIEELASSPTIWVGNIPSGFGHINSLGIAVVRPLTESELVAAFSEFGEVISVALRKKGGEFDAKSWALVTFSTPEAAGRALFGKTIVVDEAYDEIELKTKRADMQQLGQAGSGKGKGKLGEIAKKQSQRMKAAQFTQDRQRKSEEVAQKRDSSRAKRVEKRSQMANEDDDELDRREEEKEVVEELPPRRRTTDEAVHRRRPGMSHIAQSVDAGLDELQARIKQKNKKVAGAPKKKGKAKGSRRRSVDGSFRHRGGRGKNQLRNLAHEEEVASASAHGGGEGEEAPEAVQRSRRRPRQVPRRRASQTDGVRAVDAAAAEDEDGVDRTTVWSTAWVGGVPASYVSKHAEVRMLRLFKSFGKVVRVTVRKKPDEGPGQHKCWGFVTFADSGSVGAAMRNPPALQGDGYDTVVSVKPAAVST